MSIWHLNDGEDFWRGIRDGGRAHRRAQMYQFMHWYQTNKQARMSSENQRIYEVCLRTAKRLSRTKNWKEPG